MTPQIQNPLIFRTAGRRRLAWAVLVSTFLLGACARVNDTGLRMVSSGRDALLLLNAQVLKGTVLLIPDRTGRASFASEEGAIRSCYGSLRHTATNAGVIDLRCDDSSNVALQFTLITETRGYAYGSTEAGTASLVFGLSDEEARAYLRAPAGKTLTISPQDGSLTLE